jgi:TATA-binding protein-associated factor Taf7
VLQFMPGEDTSYTVSTGRPLGELGGLRIDVIDDRVVVVTPTGDVLAYDADLVEAAEKRVAELEARLRAAGIEP